MLPPYATLLGISVEAGETGAPVLVMPFGDDVLGRPGFLHGGALAGLLEVAAQAALARALGQEEASFKPVTITVDYMRGGRDRPTRAAGEVTRLGTAVANVLATAWQEHRGKPIASARLNYLIRRKG